MNRSVIAVVVALGGGLFLGATAIDKQDEQSCKDRYAADLRAVVAADPRVTFEQAAQAWEHPEPECEGFLPW